jgi:hypothetical protein
MNGFTVTDARYANAANTFATVRTQEMGETDINIAQHHTLRWAAMLAWGTPLPYEAPLEPPRTIPLDVIEARMTALGLWDNYVNWMFGTNPRRNAFCRVMFIGQPIRADSAPFLTTMQGAGFTQPQIDAVLA